VGPIYFGLHNYPLIVVIEWAFAWTAIRWFTTWKAAFSTLQNFDADEVLSWPDRHPSILMLGCIFVTLLTFEAVHVGFYYLVRGWI
jgi:hypothetical protein